MLTIILYGLTPITDRILEMCRKELEEGKVVFKIVLHTDPLGKKLDGVIELCSEKEAFGSEYDYVIICEENYEQGMRDIEKYKINADDFIYPNAIIENVCFDLCQYIELRKRKVSIVCDTNWGGEIYRSLYIEYNSPFIDLKIDPNEYLKLISNLSYYMRCPLEKVADRSVTGVPKGRLDDVLISFPEEWSFDAAKQNWNERIKKFNSREYVIVMCGVENRQQLEKFLKLQIKNSYLFYPEYCDEDNVIYFKEWELQKVRKKYRWFELYLRRTAYRKFDSIKEYRILDILLEDGYKERCI